MSAANVSEDDLLTCRWYAVPDTLLGGWSVANVDKDTARLALVAGEGEIACFLSEALARHIVDLHNGWLTAATR